MWSLANDPTETTFSKPRNDLTNLKVLDGIYEIRTRKSRRLADVTGSRLWDIKPSHNLWRYLG